MAASPLYLVNTPHVQHSDGSWPFHGDYNFQHSAPMNYGYDSLSFRAPQMDFESTVSPVDYVPHAGQDIATAQHWPVMLASQVTSSPDASHHNTSWASTGLVSLASEAIPRQVQRSQAPRKTLSDEDRSRMCRYAMENPDKKQTIIARKTILSYSQLEMSTDGF